MIDPNKKPLLPLALFARQQRQPDCLKHFAGDSAYVRLSALLISTLPSILQALGKVAAMVVVSVLVYWKWPL